MQASPNGAGGYAAVPPAAVAASGDGEAAPGEQLGAVRIARRVLRTVVEQAALGVPGVARLAAYSAGWRPILGRPLPQHGVALDVHGERVSVDLYLIVEPGASFLAVGTAVQEAVSAAIQHILGMTARGINVYIQDVL
ncbi:MAG TPA: Asp23/Gls24 family envelope stress response protein [Ktedonobacterales bacterium]|nr:Asp23/Gls24 family envelope stress response protein [Ktedonobacterales bacterium]